MSNLPRECSMLFLREIATTDSSLVITSVSSGIEGIMFSVISLCSDVILSSRFDFPVVSIKSN